MLRLDKQVAVVTGAGSGIGEGIALALAREGATVILAGRRRERLEAVAARIEQAGGRSLVAPADVTVEEEVVRLFQETVESLGRLDILVNNAGIAEGGATEDLSLEIWQRVLDVNLTGAFLCCREALRIMKPVGSGRIINIGSVSALVPRLDSAAYTTSKFGLEGLTRSLALDARPSGIAVSILHPGNTATPIWEGREETASREGVMSPQDVARIVVVMATLPPDVNLLEGVILPLTMPFLGRG